MDEYLKNVLYIDLSRKKFWIEDRRDLFEEYLGGVGVASKILLEECPKNANPLGPENVIVFAVGPLNGLFPLASKTVACFKSPLTKFYGESHAGGRSAVAIRQAGYGAIVIKGESETPVYVAVHGKNVLFRDASALWGLRNSITVGRVLREIEGGAGVRTIMRIGVAGENLVTYASVNTETYRHFGRLGLGAVFGSKKLKALVVSGKMTIPVSNAREYRELYDKIYMTSIKSSVMRKYHDLGTASNIIPLNTIHALPSKNLKESSFEYAENISGERLAEKYLGRRVACAHCPVACIHLASLREPYITEPYFYKTTMISYDHELLYSLGSMIGVRDAEGVLKLIDEVEKWGIDAMMTGTVLAWMTEAYERGVVGETETLGLKLEWGSVGTYIKAIEYIVKRNNEFYKAASEGLDALSSRYGGKEFALSYGGNGMPGYHTGPGTHITYLTGARHSHLDSAGYSLDQETLKGKQLSEKEIAEKLFHEESWRQILSSLVVCFFSRGIYTPEIVCDALNILGYNFNEEELKRLGKKILRNKNNFREREGFNMLNQKFPKRIFETPTPFGMLEEKSLYESVKEFYNLLKDFTQNV
ncbi:MAG: aldehyde ferredoxin oxidoreductase family protein [Nitrososphaeria archaeon]